MQDSERAAWLEERRKHLGASEAAAVLGLNPHMTPLDVFVSKCCPELAEEREDTDFLDFGTEMEVPIERRYVKLTGNKVYKPSPAIVVHPQFPELACTPDGLCDSPEPIVIEMKWEAWSDGFGAPGSDDVPQHFLIQGCHQMACTGRSAVDFAVLHHAPPIRVYRAHRDLDLEKELIEQLRAWWADHIVKRQEPPIDASESWKNYLGKKFPKPSGNMKPFDDATDDIREAVLALRSAKEQLKATQEQHDTAANKLRDFIGDCDGVLLPDGAKVLWTLVKEAEVKAYTRKAYRKLEVREPKKK